jgi:uncharacterized membrane protein
MTMDGLLFALTLITALGCGLVAGVLFAFSSFVIRGLARLPSADGIAAMQSINVAAITPAFMTALFGTAVACAAVAVWALFRLDEDFAAFLLVGAGLYLVGTIWVTMALNVPRNNALAAVEPSAAEAEGVWARYVTEWTAWNHLRTAAALAAAGSMTIALTGG